MTALSVAPLYERRKTRVADPRYSRGCHYILQDSLEDERSEVALYKIVPYPADYTLQGLHDKWKQGNITIPRFQRQFV